MKWSDDFKVGIVTIDSQHKRLFQLIKELNEAHQAGLRGSDVEKLLEGLEEYVTRHFKLEEKYMIESNYPGFEEQQQAHAFFMKRFNEFGEELSETGMTPALVKTIQGELSEWLKEHVTSLDMVFGGFYQQWQNSK